MLSPCCPHAIGTTIGYVIGTTIPILYLCYRDYYTYTIPMLLGLLSLYYTYTIANTILILSLCYRDYYSAIGICLLSLLLNSAICLARLPCRRLLYSTYLGRFPIYREDIFFLYYNLVIIYSNNTIDLILRY